MSDASSRGSMFPDGVVPIRKSVNAVVEYIALVVEGCQTELRNLHSVQDVIYRTKGAKFARGDGVDIS